MLFVRLSEYEFSIELGSLGWKGLDVYHVVVVLYRLNTLDRIL